MCVDVKKNYVQLFFIVCDVFMEQGVEVFLCDIVCCVEVGLGMLYCYFFMCEVLFEVLLCVSFEVLVDRVKEFEMLVVLDQVLLVWLQEIVVFMYEYCGIFGLMMGVIEDFDFVLYVLCVILCSVGVVFFVCVQVDGKVWFDLDGVELFDLIVVFVWLWEQFLYVLCIDWIFSIIVGVILMN